MEPKAKTFVLTKTKTWSRIVRVYVLNKNKKYEERQLLFTTEHVCSSKQRNTRGHQVPAQYTTSDPIIIEALFRDLSYGKDFVEQGDAIGEKKQPSVVVTETDSKLIALRGLFQMANLPFNEALPYDVLKDQYEIHMSALSGKYSEKNQPLEIPHTPIDVKASIADGVQAARDQYKLLYGEPIPVVVANDLAFLDGLSTPGFDAKKYIEEKLVAENRFDEAEHLTKMESLPPTPVENEKELLHKAYFDKYSKKVPNMKSNDIAWIKAELAK